MTLLNTLRLDSNWLREAEESVLKNPFDMELITEKTRLEEELLICYKNLHSRIDAINKSGVTERADLTQMVDSILQLKKQLLRFDEISDEWDQKKEAYYWFIDQINSLLVYDHKKYRVTFREDIFKRVIAKAILSPEGKITYKFVFGTSVVDHRLNEKAHELYLIL